MKSSFILGLLASIVTAGSLQGAADYFLQIDGIKGESTDIRHPRAIEIESFSWGLTNSAANSGGGGGAGKVVFSDITFTTKLSMAGPQLFLANASTNPIPEATLFVRKTGTTTGQRQEYYEIKLQQAKVTSYSQHGNSGTLGDPVPVDQFSLNFTKITISYTGLEGTTTGTVVRTPRE